MKIPRMSSTLATVRSTSRSRLDFEMFSHLPQVLYISVLERFNVDIIKLYTSALDLDRKLKFSDYVHLPSLNKMFQYRYA